jgi:hypothetical protein
VNEAIKLMRQTIKVDRLLSDNFCVMWITGDNNDCKTRQLSRSSKIIHILTRVTCYQAVHAALHLPLATFIAKLLNQISDYNQSIGHYHTLRNGTYCMQ